MVNRLFTVLEDQPVYLPGELSRKILLMLDGDSLHQARQVCQGWNQAILNLLWGEDRAAVERKLKNNWKFAEPLIVERTVLDGFWGLLVSLSGNRVVMMRAKNDDDEDPCGPCGPCGDEEVKSIEFNIKEGKVASAFNVDVGVYGMPEKSPWYIQKVENSVVVVLNEKEEDSKRRVLVCNLQTQQITFDKVVDVGEEVYDEQNGLDELIYPAFNETTKEIYMGRIKLKIIEDTVIEETVENYLVNIIVLRSNRCITQRRNEGTKLWRCDGNNFQGIKILNPYPNHHNPRFKISSDTSKIVAVCQKPPFGTAPFSLLVWNSDTGNLVQEVTLPSPHFIGTGNEHLTSLVNFEIERNHLVLFVRTYQSLQYCNHYDILIYELERVLAGD